MYTEEDCKRDTLEHIAQVQTFMTVMIKELAGRAMVHDKSKMEAPELEYFTEYSPKLKGSTFGSEEYKKNLEGLQVALAHHYAENSHHPEHFPNGIRGMNLLDVLEMFCDWKAATLRHADGDIDKSIDINQKRFNISDDLTEIFRNTAKLFG